MFAGLLASSCTEGGNDDSNVVFIETLGNLTSLQAKLFAFSCEKADKMLKGDLINSAREFVLYNLDEISAATGCSDIQRLDIETDSLRQKGLLTENGGLHPDLIGTIILTPSAFGLHMYIRCCGSRKKPAEFFANTITERRPQLYPTNSAATQR
jgi:hypothetical protein